VINRRNGCGATFGFESLISKNPIGVINRRNGCDTKFFYPDPKVWNLF